MAVKIRLQRGGAKGKPMYRLVVADSRAPRDGRFVEVVGTYNPTNKIEGEQIKVKLDRTDYWIGVGAQPSDTVRTLINRARREAAARGVEKAPAPAPAQQAAAKPAPAATSVAEGDAAAAAGEGSTVGGQPSASAAEKEATEVANRSAESSPTGEPVAGGAEDGATAKAPTEAEEQAEEENKG